MMEYMILQFDHFLPVKIQDGCRHAPKSVIAHNF